MIFPFFMVISDLVLILDGSTVFRIFALLFQYLHHCYAQDIPTIQLCPDDKMDEMSTDLNFGRITHIQSDVGRNNRCALMFTNLHGESEYIVFTGTPNDIKEDGCESKNFATLNGLEPFCPGNEEVVVMKVRSETANMYTLISNPSFSIEFYNQG